MMFSKKSKPFDLDHELLVALDKARAAGMTARAIAAAFQARADAERQRDAVSRPWSGATQGIVRVWHADKGWGFIRLLERLPDGRCRPINDRSVPDTFVHISQLRKAGLLTLSQHDVVRFEEGTDNRSGKPWAVEIELAA